MRFASASAASRALRSESDSWGGGAIARVRGSSELTMRSRSSYTTAGAGVRLEGLPGMVGGGGGVEGWVGGRQDARGEKGWRGQLVVARTESRDGSEEFEKWREEGRDGKRSGQCSLKPHRKWK